MKYKIITVFTFIMVFISIFCANGFANEKEIHIMKLSGAISPGTSSYMKKSIQKVADENSACLIIELDTPGGNVESMRNIVMAILDSKVPIVVYVSPSGARAASAGVMITNAADIAAMAPGTNIGAAHPVQAGGREIEKTMSEKITNDMVANARSIAEKRGRNAQWVEKAIRESVSATETEALEKKIIDIVAKDIDDLIRQIDGKILGEKGKLKLKGLKRNYLEETISTKILKTISDPNIAYILMMIGLAGLYFELSHPGAIFPGVIGAISIILFFYASQTLPVNYAGILLIILAIIFFILEMKITSFGLLSIAGVVSLLLGSLMLFEGSGPGGQLSLKVLLPTLVFISSFFVVVAGLAFRAQVSKPRTGDKGLIGEIGVVKKEIDPEGKILVHGELWKAISKKSVKEGVKVKVIGIKNLVLEVESID